MNFGVAMGITYWLATVNIAASDPLNTDNETESEWVEFAVDKLLSYIFGFTMSVMESFLVSIAVCGAAEKCPNCLRSMFRCCSSLLLGQALCCAVGGFVASMVFIV